ncbi:Uncharacterized phage protein gp47/JayE [Thermanaeromonas toyohensis ToBE]|uniref:Uncharacterized phage protein gp47/JayE n=1 Tax=Thermanaeromonas toyohensis ToBE TaxID=698762 RepID=A0A1W1VXW8_9FIRM|nr:baseplate J/gp47 family protein [Thermanaeromonas toyohensis]SMB97931.1 Uncharacterized phage protein gp47/JayE [Thermanaeromonas toyohensis ToBE]
MATLPEYLTEQTEENILKRMLDSLPADLDKAEGSYLWDALAPAAMELAQAAIWAQEVLRRGFASTTFGQYLDLRCEEHGITRKPAVKATGQVKFTGLAGTVVPAGTRVATPADPTTGTPSIEFVTTASVTLDSTGTGYAPIEAVKAGASGNVAAGAISILVTPVSGVSAVTNPSATSGGLDQEDDASLLARFLQRVRSPSAGGNKADYVNWAMEVTGVGGVSVVPVRDGPGTVSIAVINTNKEPADQALVDAVQNYIAPPWVNEIEAENMTLGGYGTSIDTTLTDDTGDSVKMVYDASGPGTITHSSLHTLLQQPGIWQARVRIKVDNNAGTADLLQVGIWNVSAAAWAKTRPGGTIDAVITLKASDLATAFDDKIVEFYWNGQDQLELRITRLTTDTTTIVWVDRAVYRSTFSKDTGEGKAPIGARVTVEPATAVLINISATLTIAPGYNADSVKSAVVENLKSYIRSLAFADDNDVRYARIGTVILDTPGVLDYSNLLVNGGTSNIAIGPQEVAVLGTVTLT